MSERCPKCGAELITLPTCIGDRRDGFRRDRACPECGRLWGSTAARLRLMLPEEAERARREVPDLPPRHPDQIPQAEVLRAVNASLLAALEAVEWLPGADILGGEGNYCPWCENEQDDGHAPDCQRQAALRRAKGEK